MERLQKIKTKIDNLYEDEEYVDSAILWDTISEVYDLVDDYMEDSVKMRTGCLKATKFDASNIDEPPHLSQSVQNFMIDQEMRRVRMNFLNDLLRR